MDDTEILDRLVKIATKHPKTRLKLAPIIRAAAEIVYPASSIGAPSKVKGDAGSDAKKDWMKGQFTQEEGGELQKVLKKLRS